MNASGDTHRITIETGWRVFDDHKRTADGERLIDLRDALIDCERGEQWAEPRYVEMAIDGVRRSSSLIADGRWTA